MVARYHILVRCRLSVASAALGLYKRANYGASISERTTMVLPPNARAFLHLASFVAAAAAASLTAVERAIDPCAEIGGQKWVAPSALRACFTSVKVDPTIKENVRIFLASV